MALEAETIIEWHFLVKGGIKQFSEMESDLEVIRSGPLNFHIKKSVYLKLTEYKVIFCIYVNVVIYLFANLQVSCVFHLW
jgi:hypothetical protein